jgi:hypothetical protein
LLGGLEIGKISVIRSEQNEGWQVSIYLLGGKRRRTLEACDPRRDIVFVLFIGGRHTFI